MSVIPILVSNAESTPIPLRDGAGRQLANVGSGRCKVFNPVGNTDSVAVHCGAGDAGVTPDSATASTAALDVVVDSSGGAVTIPAGFLFEDHPTPEDPGHFWGADAESVYAAPTAGAGEVTVTGDTTDGNPVTIPAGKRVCKAAHVATGPYWDTDAETVLPGATYGTASARFTIDNDGNEVTIPAAQGVKKAAVTTVWETDAESVTPSATPSEATVTMTGAQGTVYPLGTDVKKAAVATIWNTDAEATIVNGVTATPSTAAVTLGIDTTAGQVTVPAGSHVKVAAVAGNWDVDNEVICPAATFGTCVDVDLMGTPGTVIAAGKRICKAADAATGPYWALDAEKAIGVGGSVKGSFTCTTIGIVNAAAYSLDTIKDAVAGWLSVENDSDATPGVTETYNAPATVTCATLGAVAAAPGAIDTVVDVIAGWNTVTNALAATLGTDAADGTIDVGVTCSVNGATAAIIGSLDTVVGGPVGHTSVTNAVAATPGLPIVATVDCDVTCTVRGTIAAVATSLDTIVAAPAHVSAVTNPLDAVPGLTTTPSDTVGITCLTLDAIAAVAASLDTIKDAVTGWTAVTNAGDVTPGLPKDHADSIAVSCTVTGPVTALADTITDPSGSITGLISATNPLDAVVGDDGTYGTDADVTLPPGSGHPFSPQIASVECLALGAAPIVVQLLTGADAEQENIVTLKGVEIDVDLDASAANTARTTGTLVLPTQNVAADGTVSPSGSLVTNPIHVKLTNGTAAPAVDAANTARTTGTIVQAVQHVDAAGKVQPAGDDPARPINITGPVTATCTGSVAVTGQPAFSASDPGYEQDSTAQALTERCRWARAQYDPRGIYSYRQGDITVVRTSDTRLTLSGMTVVPTTVDQLVAVLGGAVAGHIDQVDTLETITGTWTAGVGGGTLDRSTGVWPAVIMGMTWCQARRGYTVATDSDRVSLINGPNMDIPHGGWVGVDGEEYQIDVGKHFTTTDTDTSVDNAAPKYHSLTAPNTTTRCHVKLLALVGGAGKLELFENPTINAAGTAITPKNDDRNSATVAALVVKYNPTSTADGTLIWSKYIAAAGEIQMTLKKVLLQAEEYFVKWTPDGNGISETLTVSHFEV